MPFHIPSFMKIGSGIQVIQDDSNLESPCIKVITSTVREIVVLVLQMRRIS
jgi:hypothetical protein